VRSLNPPEPPGASITVVVVNFNSGTCLARCIAALAGQTYRDFGVIVVDNGSTDDSLCALDHLPAGWEAIRLGRNTGFAAANNLAFARSEAPWVATLNPDAFPDPDWLAQLMLGVERYPGAAAFGSLQIDANRPDRLDGIGDACHVSGMYWRGGFGQPIASQQGEGEVVSVCAAAALYRRERILALGGFDEDFFCYGEDVDLGIRLRLLGHRSVQLANAVVRHVGGGSGGGRSDFAIYHGTRNRLWLFVKNMPPVLFWPLLPLHGLATIMIWLCALLNGESANVRRGVIDAFRGLPRIWHKRHQIQSSRKASILPLLCWSPLAILQRRAVVRPLAVRACLRPGTGEGGVGIAMVSYRSGPVLLDAVQAALTDAAVERLVVVDNGNPPEIRGPLASLAAREPRLRIIEGQGNIGFAAGCNLGARHIESDFLLLLNPDCILPAGAAARLRQELQRLSMPAVLGTAMIDEAGRVQRATRRNLPTLANLVGEALRLDRLLPSWPRLEIGGPLPDQTVAVPAISGAAMFLSRENYWAMGGLDAGYFLHVEDLDFCTRFREAGGQVCLVPGLRLRHERSSSDAAPMLVEWHKAQGFRRYFRQRRLAGWQRLILDAAVVARLALMLIALAPACRRRGSGSGSGAASAPPDRA
jgi:N-acetylglucosaminyl-diphospho-decaprenol L-rhamnosyltransferase